MPGTGSYIGSNVNSDYIYDVGTALELLKDNNSNLIDPKDIRDSVWTLWNRIDDVQIVASQSATQLAGNYYTNPNPVPVAIGGIAANTTFAGTYSMQQMFDLLLYPYVAPVASLSLSNPIYRQFNSSGAATLSWTATRRKNPITSIVVNGTTIVQTGDTQTGSISVTATHSAVGLSGTTQLTSSFNMSVSDGTTTQSASATIYWRHKIYWGAIDLSSLGVNSLENNPGVYASVAALCDDNAIKSLNGAGSGSGSELAVSYVKTYSNINGGGNFLVFAHPTVFGASPRFTFNTLELSSMTKIRSNDDFVTETGIVVKYDVWIKNTADNSPATITIGNF
jgi:hypothetical protein